MKARANVALAVETATAYGRQILRGVARFQRTHGGWSVFLDTREVLPPRPNWLIERGCDGVICRATPALAEAMREIGLAAVDVNDRYGFLGIPRVGSDMEAIGRMGAEHLLERGFRNIAFFGFSGEAWSAERLAGAQEAVRERGHFCGTFESPSGVLHESVWWKERSRIGTWLQALPRPLGIVACSDMRAYHVLDTCRVLDIAVPEEVAVVGVDNAETFCELCVPSLSSVVPNAERIGFEAAQLLDRLLAGEAVPSANSLIAPRGVITRQSSDVLAVDDPALATALRFVRERAGEGITVADVLAHAPLSRSALERGFRSCLGHSPQAEIRRVRLKRIKHLLAETDWPLARIARATGFDSADYMMVQFKRLVGQTPSQWRQAHQSNQL